jgi:hypothetical protein
MDHCERREGRRYTDVVRSVDRWPGVAPEGRWATELFDELMETTNRTPAELRAHASELRAQADATDITGYRSAYVMLAARCEETAAARETAA